MKKEENIWQSLKEVTPKKKRVFHPYFTSQPHNIVSEYIKTFSKENEMVLDPFIGSGVTLLESQFANRKSIGIDLSSFACFISKVSNIKYKNLDKIDETFNSLKKKVFDKISSFYELNKKDDSLETSKNFYFLDIPLPSNSDANRVKDLFTDKNLKALLLLKINIDEIKDEEIKDFFRGIFSGILHRASKTFFYDKLKWGGGNSGIFTKYRYWIPPNPDERNVWELFEIRYKRISSLIKSLNKKIPEGNEPKIFNESATNMSSIKSNSIDYIYTDPPYGANINYLDLSTMWCAWLELPLNEKDKNLEVIEGGGISHTKEDYIRLLKESFKEMYRVLKNDKFLSIAFSHKDLKLWYEILNGCEEVGFEYINTTYYPSYYKSFHKIKNPLRVLSGQMVITFQKTKNPKRVSLNNIGDSEQYMINQLRKIIQVERELSTEKIFSLLIPNLLEKGVIKDNGKINVIKVLEDNFEYDNEINKWYDSKSTISELTENIKNKEYDVIAFDFPKIRSRYEVKYIPNLIKKIKSSLKRKGTLWVTVENSIAKDKIIPTPFILAEEFKKEGFKVQNIIVWVTKTKDKHLLSNYYKHILFLTLEDKEYYLDKNAIREKHIWANVEWGNRKFRYNEKGKDPGNVWLPTEDDGKGNIIKHRILSEEQKDERIFLCSTKERDSFCSISNKEKSYFSKMANEKKVVVDFIKYDNSNSFEDSFNDFKIEKVIPKHDSSKKKHKICFNSSEEMKQVKDKSIRLIVTSPPYWDLKDYENEKQIGYKETYGDYHKRMNKVWKECMRVLEDDGTIWININSRKSKGEYFGIQYDIIKNMNNLGFKLIEIIIWHKSSGIPVSSKNFTDRFEYILGFTKSNLRKLKINDVSFKDYLFEEEFSNVINVWNMNRRSGSIGKDLPHPAMFPDELPVRLISLLTENSSIILDPFLGSGTTTVAAIRERRNSYGFEINTEYKKLINLRITESLRTLDTHNDSVEFI
ncbi:MAG: DNA methyltransferase [Nanoarchaeota archaeon]